ncbi:uncharacterized protein LOC130434552 [Triplophysa dalaica]|uniref:uncharacterized protein LOC130434552 n=1 Tax=Triplophysa dalaica TaxID=1582913 RepID=UPI0024E0041F|nr:uncharacterized protein LOC130434552 [Triplophysa dalaica]
MVWVCGETAYYHLDAGEWKGCCYAAILSTGTSIMEKTNLATSLNRHKREVKLPNYYAGHKISDPWTTPWENVGWSLADYADNVTDVVKHMRESVREPTPVDATWFQWLDSLSGGWGYWITGTVIPVVMTILALLLFLPCMLQCGVGCVKRSVTSFTTKGTDRMMLAKRTTDVNQAMLVRRTSKGYRPKDQNQTWGSIFDHNSDTDEDDNDCVQTHELEPEPIPVMEEPRNVDGRDNVMEGDNGLDDSVIEIGTVDDEE